MGTMEAITEQLFSEVTKTYKEHLSLTDEVLSALQFTFGAPLIPALALVDDRRATVLKSPSGRMLYQVIGSSGNPYTFFSSSDYCSCPAYKFSVLKKEDQLMCKHVIALKLSRAMGLLTEQQVSDNEITQVILNME